MVPYSNYTRLNGSAEAASGAMVTVFDPPGQTVTKASLFQDSAGTVPLNNPFPSNTGDITPGYFQFFAQPGVYDIAFAGGGILTPYSWPSVSVGEGGAGWYVVTTEAALLAALLAIGVNPATILISTNVAIAASVTIPVNVSCWFISPGRFTIATGQTVTFQGAILSDRHQIFAGAGVVDVFDAKLDWVYPEWWGAVALKAGSGIPPDSTVAMVAAVDSRRNVLFDQGIYGIDSDEMLVATDGQKVWGNGGMVPVDGQGGTILYRLGGTNAIIRGGSYTYYDVRFFRLDGGGISAPVVIWQGLYCLSESIRGSNTGNSFAFEFRSMNLCQFTNWFADDTAGNGFYFNPLFQCLYSKFISCGTGQVVGGVSLDIENTAGMTFFGFYHDGKVYVHGINQSTHFTDTNSEVGGVTTGPAIEITGTDCLNTVFRGLRMYRAIANNSHPEIRVSGGAKSTHITDVYYNDLVSAAGKTFIELNNAPFTRFDNIETYVANALDLVKCVGTRSDDLSLSSVFAHSGAVPLLNLWTARCTIEDSNCNVAFNAASESVIFQTVSGTITRANLSYPTLINSGADVVFAFADGDTTPSVAAGSFFAFQNTGPTTVTNFDDAYTGTGPSIMVRFDDANTTLDLSGNANMIGNNGVDFTGAVGDFIMATRVGSVWYVQVGLG